MKLCRWEIRFRKLGEILEICFCEMRKIIIFVYLCTSRWEKDESFMSSGGKIPF